MYLMQDKDEHRIMIKSGLEMGRANPNWIGIKIEKYSRGLPWFKQQKFTNMEIRYLSWGHV